MVYVRLHRQFVYSFIKAYFPVSHCRLCVGEFICYSRFLFTSFSLLHFVCPVYWKWLGHGICELPLIYEIILCPFHGALYLYLNAHTHSLVVFCLESIIIIMNPIQLCVCRLLCTKKNKKKKNESGLFVLFLSCVVLQFNWYVVDPVESEKHPFFHVCMRSTRRSEGAIDRARQVLSIMKWIRDLLLALRVCSVQSVFNYPNYVIQWNRSLHIIQNARMIIIFFAMCAVGHRLSRIRVRTFFVYSDACSHGFHFGCSTWVYIWPTIHLTINQIKFNAQETCSDSYPWSRRPHGVGCNGFNGRTKATAWNRQMREWAVWSGKFWLLLNLWSASPRLIAIDWLHLKYAEKKFARNPLRLWIINLFSAKNWNAKRRTNENQRYSQFIGYVASCAATIFPPLKLSHQLWTNEMLPLPPLSAEPRQTF